METLFSDTEGFQKERPKTLSSIQKEEFFKLAANDIIAQGYSDGSIDSIVYDLNMLFPTNDNGYEMAKSLENSGRCNYNCSTEFCEWLDSLSSDYQWSIKSNVETWVKAHNIKPLFAKGDKLLVNSKFSHSINVGTELYVNRIDETYANYLVHPKEGTGGYVIEFERIEKCCTKI